MITIVSDTDAIHNFVDDTVIPNEAFQMTGMVEINTTRPLDIKEIKVCFQGSILSVVNALDSYDKIVRNDQIPIDQWTTKEAKRFKDKLSRTSLGQNFVGYTLVKECVTLVNETYHLPMGKTRLPFCLKVNNVPCLPATLFLPNHLIQYELSATIKLNSFSQQLKQTFRNNKLKSNKVKIEIFNHSFPNITLLDPSRIRYRGNRKEKLNYEISMTKFTCLQSKCHRFICQFDSLHLGSKIRWVEFYLEQTEIYPIRAGNYNTVYKINSNSLVARHRKLSRTKHDMANYENGKELELSLSLDLPHISSHIETQILKISHTLKLILKFNNDKNMSLSFPLFIGTVPTNTTTVQPQMKPWPTRDVNERLPSYLDVLKEGNPPSPFLENH